MINKAIYIPYLNKNLSSSATPHNIEEKPHRFREQLEEVGEKSYAEIQSNQRLSHESETATQICLDFEIKSFSEESCERYQKSIQNLIDLLEVKVEEIRLNERGEERLAFSLLGNPVDLMGYKVFHGLSLYNGLNEGYFFTFYRKLLSEAYLYAKNILLYYLTEESIKNNKPKSDDETFIIQIHPSFISKFFIAIFKSWSIQTDFLENADASKEKIFIKIGGLEIVALTRILHMFNTSLNPESSEEKKIECNSQILLGQYYSLIDKRVNFDISELNCVCEESEKYKKLYIVPRLDIQVIQQSIENFKNMTLKKDEEKNFSSNNSNAFYQSFDHREISSTTTASVACAIC